MTAARAWWQTAPPPGPQLASPFSTQLSSLSTIVWSDIFGDSSLPMTRAQAMAIPAIAKARHVVAPKIAGYPIRAFDSDDVQLPDPLWAYRSNDGISPWHRMLWTIDDLIFTGFSLWEAFRGSEGQLLYASRVGRDRWNINADYMIEVDGQQVDAADFILIPGPHEGILTFARVAIVQAADLMRAAGNAARTPSAHQELHQTDGLPMDKTDIDELLAQYAEGRRGTNGGVSYTPPNIEVRDHGSIDSHLLVEGRNASAVDCARVVGVAAGMVDATAPKASLNYETQEGRGLEHTEYGTEPYLEAVEARLSLDDVTARGTRCRFDKGDDLSPQPSPTGPSVQD